MRAHGNALAPLRRLAGLALLAAAVHAGAATATDVADDPALEARVNQVSAELRCLVCQNQSLADSHATLALDLKAQVREQLRAGRSEQQVLDYMTDRYGDFVRYRPAWKATTVLLWTGPFVLGLVALAALWRQLGRRTPRPAADGASAASADRNAATDGAARLLDAAEP